MISEKGQVPQSKILDLGKWDSNAIKHYNKLPRIQKELRKGNWEYLNAHPEVCLYRNLCKLKFNPFIPLDTGYYTSHYA